MQLHDAHVKRYYLKVCLGLGKSISGDPLKQAGLSIAAYFALVYLRNRVPVTEVKRPVISEEIAKPKPVWAWKNYLANGIFKLIGER